MIFVGVDIILLILLSLLYIHIKKRVKANKNRVKEYGKNVAIGVVAGIMVIVIDRWVAAVNWNALRLDFTSVSTLGTTALNAFLTALLYIFVLLLLVLWVYSLALPHKK